VSKIFSYETYNIRKKAGRNYGLYLGSTNSVSLYRALPDKGSPEYHDQFLSWNEKYACVLTSHKNSLLKWAFETQDHNHKYGHFRTFSRLAEIVKSQIQALLDLQTNNNTQIVHWALMLCNPRELALHEYLKTLNVDFALPFNSNQTSSDYKKECIDILSAQLAGPMCDRELELSAF
jgi:hypothetical protein